MSKRKATFPPAAPLAISRRLWWWCSGLIAVVGLVYANSITAPFIFDDLPAIEQNQTIRHLWPLTGPLHPASDGGTGVAGRPVVNLSLAINYAISGTAPWSYHVANALIHALAALALFGLVRRTLQSPALRERWADRADPVAFAAALLWAVHPLQTESVTCVIQRTESLVGLLYLVVLYAFARVAGTDEPRARFGWSAACVAACAVGMATKEVMVTAPVMLLLFDRTFFSGSFRATLRHRWLHYACFATWALLFLLLQGNPLRGGTAGYDRITSWEYLLTQCRAIVLYLRLAVWPRPLVMDYGTAHAEGLLSVLPQALLLVALALGTIWAGWRRPALGFLGTWFFVILSPSSSVVPLATQTIAEHRMYLPLAAPVVLVAAWLARRAFAWFWPVTFATACVLGGLTIARNQVYRSPAALWQDNLVHWPANPRPYAALAHLADDAGDFKAALTCYENYLRLDPDELDMRFNYGRDLVKVGRRQEALREFETILARRPAETAVRISYATCLLAMERVDEALRNFEIVVRQAPQAAQNHFNLGEALMRAGRNAEALASYRQAVTMKTDSAFFFLRYGEAQLKSGRPADAIDAYRSAVRLQPEFYEAWTNLGGCLLMSGRVQEAIPALEMALRLKPNEPQARQNLEYARSLLR